MNLSKTLQDRRKWFSNQAILGVQVVDTTGILKKLPENTWIVSIDRFLSLLD
jgi:hypothetical protein